MSLSSPCIGGFVPLYLEGTVPAALAIVGAEPLAASPWWRLRTLLSLVERDVARYAPRVRSQWDAFEHVIAAEAHDVEAAAAARPHTAADLLTDFMHRVTARYLAQADALIAELQATS